MKNQALGIHCSQLVELLYTQLDLPFPQDAAHKQLYLQYILSKPKVRRQVRELSQELAQNLNSTPREVLKALERLRQCELPPRIRRLIIDFSKTTVITNGCQNSKGAGIPNCVRKIFALFIFQQFKTNSFNLRKDEIKLVAASCIS